MLSKDEILEKAKQEQHNHNYEKTLELLKEIFDIKEYFIAFEYAKTLYLLKKYEEAINIFLILNKNYKNNDDVIDFIIKCYRENNKLEDLFNFIKNNDVSNSKISLEIAETFFVEKKYKESIKFYEQYIIKQFDDIAIVSKLLQIYNFLGYKKNAIELACKYLENNSVKSSKFLYNLFLNELEIAQEKTILESKPRIMLVMLTNKCNLRCPMCATIHQGNHWNISDKFKKYILDNLENLELVTWQGGEVFLYKEFKNLFLKATENKYLKQIIITNGLLINEEWANLIVKANHLDLTISIDSIEKQIYEKLRVGAKFEQLLLNLENIRIARIKNNSNITVTVRTTISDENIYTLDKIVDFAVKYNINVLIWSPLIMEENRQYSLKNKNNDELLKLNLIIDKAFKKAQEYKIKIIYLLENIKDIMNKKQEKDNIMKLKQEIQKEQNLIKGKKYNINESVKNGNLIENNNIESLCFRPWKQIATTVEGKFRPECICLENVDDMHKCENFDLLWNNEIMQEYRKKMIGFNQQWCCDNCKNNIVTREHKKFTCW